MKWEEVFICIKVEAKVKWLKSKHMNIQLKGEVLSKISSHQLHLIKIGANPRADHMQAIIHLKFLSLMEMKRIQPSKQKFS